jgi:adenosine 3'-phospho 5'-phosphosulfate transporter B2
VQVKGKTEELRPVAPILSYASVSLSNVAATTCQYEALKHVTFAVQTLGKCAKMFPVMIWGYFILKKRYTIRDVMLAVLITTGCFIFFMTGPTASRVAQDKNSSMFGILLMMGYLSADGYTSTFQQKMFKGYQMTSYNQVLYVSMCSIALSSFGEWGLLETGKHRPSGWEYESASSSISAAGTVLQPKQQRFQMQVYSGPLPWHGNAAALP